MASTTTDAKPAYEAATTPATTRSEEPAVSRAAVPMPASAMPPMRTSSDSAGSRPGSPISRRARAVAWGRTALAIPAPASRTATAAKGPIQTEASFTASPQRVDGQGREHAVRPRHEAGSEEVAAEHDIEAEGPSAHGEEGLGAGLTGEHALQAGRAKTV